MEVITFLTWKKEGMFSYTKPFDIFEWYRWNER